MKPASVTTFGTHRPRGRNTERLRGAKVAVLGDGVVGLNTALEAQRQGASVTVYSETRDRVMASRAASDKACALWYPLLIGGNRDTLNSWCRRSYASYERMAKEGVSGVAGITNIEIIDSEKEFCEPPDAIRELPAFSARRDGVAGLRGCPAGVWRFATFVVEMPVHLMRMREMLMRTGCVFRHETFSSVDDIWPVVPEHAIVFNCLGLGARNIFGDSALREIKGHLLLFRPQPLQYAVGRYDVALIPRRDALVCGTLFLDDCVLPTPTDDEREHILGEVRSWIDVDAFDVGLRTVSLSQDQFLSEVTGFRPYREGGIRLEAEELNGRLVIHDYGHGGSGVTVAPACATDAVALASERA
jgi:D-amino-acid oxidase